LRVEGCELRVNGLRVWVRVRVRATRLGLGFMDKG
jgi:hypothetical protein